MIFSRPASYDTAYVYAHKDLGKDTVLREEFINGGWKKYNSKSGTLTQQYLFKIAMRFRRNSISRYRMSSA